MTAHSSKTARRTRDKLGERLSEAPTQALEKLACEQGDERGRE